MRNNIKDWFCKKTSGTGGDAGMTHSGGSAPSTPLVSMGKQKQSADMQDKSKFALRAVQETKTKLSVITEAIGQVLQSSDARALTENQKDRLKVIIQEFKLRPLDCRWTKDYWENYKSQYDNKILHLSELINKATQGELSAASGGISLQDNALNAAVVMGTKG